MVKKIILIILMFFSFNILNVLAGNAIETKEAVYKNCVGLLNKQQLIALPKNIKSVQRILSLNKKDNILFLIAKENDNKTALWSYTNNKFNRVLKLDKSNANADGFIHYIEPYLYFEINNPHFFYRSVDNGKTWLEVFDQKEVFWAMAKGKNKYYGTAWSFNSPHLYISNENGLDWKVWQNFHKVFPEYAKKYDVNDERYGIRHLHDIAIYKNNILVGTGDVARFTFLSQDQGLSWNKIWNEGFTAHLILPNDKILLAGDKTNSELALYDFKKQTTKIVWSAKKSGWAGYIYSMLEKNNKYYFAAHLENGVKLKYGVMGSCDGLTWQPVWEIKSAINQKESSAYLADGPKNTMYLSMDGKLYKLY